MSSDIKLAKIYFVTGDSANKKEVEEGFDKAGGFIKRSLAKELKLRYMPDLRFYYDDTLDYSFRIEEILKKISDEDVSEPEI